MPFHKLHPFDEVGLTKHRPTTESKYTKLTNLITLDGRLRFRPGFIPVGPDQRDIDLEDVEWGIPVLIDEVANTGGLSLSDRPGSERAAETLRPDSSTTLVAGWTGDYSDIDEVVPDGVDYLESATASSMQKTGFANLSGTYDNFYGIVIRGRARQNQNGGVATLNVYHAVASVTTFIEAITIYASTYDVAEVNEDDWQSFAIPLYIHPRNLTPFTQSLINGFEVALEHGGGTTNSDNFEYLPITGDGNYSDWDQYLAQVEDIDNTDTASYTDFDSRLIDGVDYSDGFATTTWVDVVSKVDRKHSFTMGNLAQTYNTIKSASIRVWVGNYGIVDGSRITIYFRTGGVDYEVGSSNIEGGGPPDGQTVEFDMDVNPATSTAWTNATLNGSEWVVERVGGRPVLMGGDLKVQGNLKSIPTIQVDNLAVDVYPINDPLPDRLLVSTKNYFLLEGDDDGFTNIQGDATATAIGAVPHDSATLYGQFYMVDGTTTRRYPNNPSDSDWEDLTDNDGAGTGAISGRTVASFADRILYGWVSDAGDVTPERVAYSKEFNGGTHNDNSAGDFDILITPGGVVCLEPLNDDLCACYKETGIYILRRSGFSFAPIIPDPVDMETSLIAEATVKSVTNQAGNPIQFFLGKNAKGINVFQFDGVSVIPVGDNIQPVLRDDTNKATLPNSYAEVDPIGGFYWLFVPEGDQLFPEQAWVMNLQTGIWTRSEFPWPVPVAGRWTLRGIDDAPKGERRMIVGLGDNLPYKADYSSGHDILHAAAGSSTAEFYEFSSTGVVGPKRGMIDATLETGDWGSPDGQDVVSWDPKRLHIWYYDQGPYEMTLSWSKNGGKDFVTGNTYWIGSPDDDGSLRYSVLEFPDPDADDDSPLDGKKVMFKIAIGNDDDMNSTYPDVAEAVVEWEMGGEN